jgi:uncharacterized membrane protein
MNLTAHRELWERLRNAGLVQGDVPSGMSSPWHVRAMLGIAGWIGAIFIISYLSFAFSMTKQNEIILAIICCITSYVILRLAPKNDFSSQFGLAIGLVGQYLFGSAILRYFHAEASLGWLIFFFFEAALTIIMPNFIHRIFTTVATVGALFLSLSQSGLNVFVLPLTAAGCAVVWRGEIRLAAQARFWQPVGYGLAIGVLLIAAMTLSSSSHDLFLFNKRFGDNWLKMHGAEIGTALISVVFLALTVTLLRSLDIKISGKKGITALICAAVVMAASFPAHGLAPASLILILGFAGGNRILFGLGIVALGSFLSYYYYQLNDTLLIKSFILGQTGILLLVARWALRRLFTPSEAKEYA